MKKYFKKVLTLGMTLSVLCTGCQWTSDRGGVPEAIAPEATSSLQGNRSASGTAPNNSSSEAGPNSSIVISGTGNVREVEEVDEDGKLIYLQSIDELKEKLFDQGVLFYGKSVALSDEIKISLAPFVPMPTSLPSLASGRENTSNAASAPQFDAQVASSAESGATFDTSAQSSTMMKAEVMEADFGASKNAYSTTNVQVQGVAESDIIQTDGRYIYCLNQEELSIVDATEMKVISRLNIQNEDYEENLSFNEMYLSGDKLVISAYRNIPYSLSDVKNPDAVPLTGASSTAPLPESNIANKQIAYDIAYPYHYQNNYSSFLIFDITDKSQPKQVRTVDIAGDNLTTRMIGSKLYFVTGKYLGGLYREDLSDETLLPSYRDFTPTQEQEGIIPLSYVDVKTIAIFPNQRMSNYMLVGGFDINGTEPVVPNAFLGSGQTFYMNSAHFYAVTEGNWNRQDGKETNIYQFAVEGANLVYKNHGYVPGYLVNQFAMDEYEGRFRVATTTNGGNGVYVYDENLNLVGKLNGLAKGETIKSVRFMGKTGYVVTYRNTDPLFVLDLSNDTPILLGELKIPGFSTYLHPVGQNYLLGLGRNTKEMFVREKDGSETVVGARDVGMKASLFDVSDPTNPTEKYTIEIGKEGTWSEALNNHKALMVDSNRNVFAFPISMYQDRVNWEGGLVIGLDPESGLDVLAELKISERSYFYQQRFCYIGNVLYFMAGGSLIAYDYGTFKEINKVSLSK